MTRPKKTTVKRIGKGSYRISFSEKDGKALAAAIKRDADEAEARMESMMLHGTEG